MRSPDPAGQACDALIARLAAIVFSLESFSQGGVAQARQGVVSKRHPKHMSQISQEKFPYIIVQFRAISTKKLSKVQYFAKSTKNEVEPWKNSGENDSSFHAVNALP